jgi:hypothetical protein
MVMAMAARTSKARVDRDLPCEPHAKGGAA